MNLQAWQAAARQNLTRLAGRLRRLAPGTLYGFLSATTLLPVVTAANQGNFAALVTLGSVVGGIGGDLVANQIQAWKDRSETELAAELQQRATADPTWRETLDTILAKLAAIQTVRETLSPAACLLNPALCAYPDNAAHLRRLCDARATRSAACLDR